MNFRTVIVCFFVFSYFLSHAQDSIQYVTIDNAIKIAVSNHPKSHNAELIVRQANIRNSTIPNLGNTEISYTNGQSFSHLYDQKLEIRQNFGSPISYYQKQKLSTSKYKTATIEQRLTMKEIIRDVKITYFQCVYLKRKQTEIQNQNTKLLFIEEILRQMNEKGDSSLFELAVLETRYADLQNELFQAQQELLIGLNQFQETVFTNQAIQPIDSTLELYAIITKNTGLEKFSPTDHISYFKTLIDNKKAEMNVDKSNYFPTFYLGYFNQEILHQSNFQGFTAGMSVPIFYSSVKQNVAISNIDVKMAENNAEYQKFAMTKIIENLKIQLDQAFVNIGYFRENALRKADLIEKTADTHLSKKTINAGDYLEAIKAATEIRLDYLSKIRDYNLTAVKLEYFIN